MTQTTRSEQILRQAVDAWNSHEPQALARIYAPDATLHDPLYPEPLRGIDNIRKSYEELLITFPDIRLRLEDSIISGDTFAAESTLTATNTGPVKLPNGATLPATNRKVTVRCANIARVDAQGRIVEERLYYDTMAFIQQLGLMPGA